MASEAQVLPRTVSVLMPTYQAAGLLERVLAALAAQRTDFPWDFTAADCGSDDGTLEIFARWSARMPVPLRVHALGRESFDHGDTRNLLAALSAGELLVYLTDDAVPATDAWLATLRANFNDPRVAAAYCRNVPRPDARAFARVATADDPTYASERREQRIESPERLLRAGPDELRTLFNYCDSASAVRRSLWERHPYPRTSVGEDVLLARPLIEAGFTVVYDHRACVLHSHDWSLERVRHRARIDGSFNSEVLGRVCIPTAAELEFNVARTLGSDRARLDELGLSQPELARELEHAEKQRRALYEGLYEGGRTRQRALPTRMLDDPRMHVGWIASEPELDANWLETARELRRRGHRVTLLLMRDDASQAPAELQDAFDAVRVVARDAGQLQAALERAGVSLAHVLCDDRELHTALDLPTIAPAPSGWTLREPGLSPGSTTDSVSTAQQIEYRRTNEAALDPRIEAAQWEFRYRALACRVGSEVLFDRWGRDADVRDGATRAQGKELVLIGPLRGALEFHVAARARGACTLELLLETLASKPRVRHRGRLIVDDRLVGEFGPLASRGAAIHTLRFELHAGDSPRRIRIEVDPADTKLARLGRRLKLPGPTTREFYVGLRRVILRRSAQAAAPQQPAL